MRHSPATGTPECPRAAAKRTMLGVALADTIPKLLNTAAKVGASGASNEANTKVLLIEPMLASLGWDPLDLDTVEREVKVFDGTFLDYALKVEGHARVYVEAKALGENLDDKKFVAQAVNYANNDGVLWCVLTDGLSIKVYKTNEPVSMDRKLLFEVNLSDESETVSDKAKLLRLISRETVESGGLDHFGERVFTDGRVRKALGELASDPPTAWLEALAAKLGAPVVPVDGLRRSLARILDAPATETSSTSAVAQASEATSPPGPPSPPKGQEYSIDHHLGNKSALIKEMFDEINSFATSLGSDVTRRVRKQYVGFFRGKRSFFTIELQHQRTVIYLSLDPSTVQPWNDAALRDARNIGHFGMGETEYSLRTVDQFGEIKGLIRTAYELRS
jgi:predicted transport protein